MSNPIKHEMDNIPLPDALHARSRIGIRQAALERSRSGARTRFGKVLGGVTAACLALCAVAATTSPGIASTLRGYFRDITGRFGVVTGVQYEHAAADVAVTAGTPTLRAADIVIPITLTMKRAAELPYRATEAVTLGQFMVISNQGTQISEDQVTVEPATQQTFSFDIQDKHKLLSEVKTAAQNERIFQGSLVIKRSVLDAGNTFTLRVDSFYQHKKADAPMETKGLWQVQFALKE